MSMSMSSLEIKNDVVLGDITELCLGSELHRNWYIKDIQRLFIVPMEIDQARLFYRDGKVIGFISWAFLSYEAENSFLNRTRKLQPEDWKSGQRIYIMDLIAPYGDVGTLGRWVREYLTPIAPSFNTDRAYWVRRYPDGSIRKIGMAFEHVTKDKSL